MSLVRLKSFLKPDKYKELIEEYNNILHTEKQIIYFFNTKEKFKFMKTKMYCELCIDESRTVKIDEKYTNNMSYILHSLGYIPNLKYFRTRSKAKLEYGIELYLDYIVGYGYIIEVAKDVQDEGKVDLTRIELGNFLESLDVDIMDKNELDKRKEEYILNWNMLTRNVDEQNFLK